MSYGWTPDTNVANFEGYGILADCSLAGYVPALPPNQTQLTIPSNLDPEFLGLAFGVQNYTCSSSNSYTSVGAVGELIDVSCYVNASWFSTIQDVLYPAWDELSQSVTIQEVIDFVHLINPPANLAQHYFVPNPVTGQGLSPKWDFTSSGKFEGNPEAYVIGRVNGTLSSPDDPISKTAYYLSRLDGPYELSRLRFLLNNHLPSLCT
ncbi:uncharacterized protein B0H18DRAFT_674912 [Fomitopsis serialis]|uniref:uncharacterized protein n=1 Tax=Fomitopsis serialis TaxID=139415 RepID=UPI00200766AB|nr:uncharacterized protein B0H18DRAFT_674912 [Neoantrodia serialis]KAH9933035.1 hypothetical protein B0H18DRAFT_674912 [Neoantrodia serialis]